MAGRWENTHELEGRIEFTSAKSRLVEDVFTGKRYWIPKSCTYDFNESSADGLFLFVVSDWWWQKAMKGEFDVEDRERSKD